MRRCGAGCAHPLRFASRRTLIANFRRLAVTAGRAAAQRRRCNRPTPGDLEIARRDLILNAAAELINDQGVGAVALSALAKSLSLSRASIYYYFSDSADVVFHCLKRSCDLEAEWLSRAADEPAGLPQVLRYLELSLSPGSNATAVVGYTEMLADEPRETIERAVQRNYARFEAMLGDGVRVGNIRPCDEQLLARVLPSMVAFYRMSHRWVDKDRDVPNLKAILDFVSKGCAADRAATFQIHHNVDVFSRADAKTLDALSLAEIRIEQILMIGSKLINARGVDGFALDDVVAMLGVTRGVFYHYFKDRDDLVRRCLERGLDLYGEFISFADRLGHNGLEKSLIVSHLNVQAQAGSLQPVAALMGLDVLTPEFQSTVSERMQGFLQRSDAMVREGIADGSCRKLDYRPITIWRAGAYHWLPHWISQIDDPNPFRVADEVVDFFRSGLAP